MRRRWWVIASALVLGAGACALNTSFLTETQSITFDETGWQLLKVTADRSREQVTVNGHANTQVDATAEIEALIQSGDKQSVLDDFRFGFTEIGSLTVRLDAIYRGEFAEGFGLKRLTVDVPQSADIDLRLSETNLVVAGMTGHVIVRNSDGDIDVRTDGDFDIEARSSQLVVVGRGGEVSTQLGSITVDATEPVLLRTIGEEGVEDDDDQGNEESLRRGIRATLAGGGEFTITHGNAEIIVPTDGFTNALRGTVEHGHVEVRLPAGLGFDLDLKTQSGVVFVEAASMNASNTVSFSEPINGGGPEIIIEITGGGDIDVVNL